MGSLERRVSKIEKGLGVNRPVVRPPNIYIRNFAGCAEISEAQIDAILGDCDDWITCKQQLQAGKAAQDRQLAERPDCFLLPIIVEVNAAKEFEARGLPIPEPQENNQ